MGNGLIKEFNKDKLGINIFQTRHDLGTAAAKNAADAIKKYLAAQNIVTMVFAAAPSQNEFLDTLVCEPGIDWNRVIAFHMDEYIGLSDTAPQRFAFYLKNRFFDKAKPGKVFYINGNTDPEKECQRYTELLKEFPLDIAFTGIGENGHLAFNDPKVADFNDAKLVKVVDLELASRQQQVHDGCFKTLAEVPSQALSLTIPALMSAKEIFCMVPGATKSNAVKAVINGEVTTEYPASILRRHQQANLYLDSDSAVYLL